MLHNIDDVQPLLDLDAGDVAVASDPTTYVKLLSKVKDKEKVKLCPFLPGCGKIYIIPMSKYAALERAMGLWYIKRRVSVPV